MREALTRRLAHVGESESSMGCAPDLILVDGGDAHVGVAREVLEDMNMEIPVFGMVKDDFHKTRALTDGAREISIAKEFDVYAFIYNLQEEAHRFAVKASSGSKTKSLTRSSLEQIEGIGPAKAKKLLSAMPLSKIKAADAEELVALCKVSKKDAENIYKHFHKN
jgi:excinuclease ABC subunit C